jgi:catecholate siderophore receptor
MFWGTRGWIAAGTPAAYAVIGETRSSLAEKEKRDFAGSTAAEATLPLKKFHIAPGPVDGAVEAYEKAGADDEGCAAGRDAGAIQLAGSSGALSRR